MGQVGWFGSKSAKLDPWRDGVQATATLERVHATGAMRRARGGAVDLDIRQMFIVFRVTDPGGSELVVERELWKGQVREPGSTVPVAYLPDDVAGSLDYDHNSVRSPDREVPRGWAAGFFEVEPLGTRCAVPPDPALAQERELFRTGRRAEATVLGHQIHALGGNQGNLRCTLELRVGGSDIETDVQTFPGWVPNPGSHIQIATDAGGSTVALDTDERYYGPPGRLLVYSWPDAEAYPGPVSPDAAGQAAAQPAPGAGPPAWLAGQIMEMKRSRLQMGKRYEKMVRGILDGQRVAGVIDDATYEDLLREALSD
jgi:hypothetical protein